jgi:hypothetical protein
MMQKLTRYMSRGTQFSIFFQAMGTIGLDVPGDYASIAAEFIIK